MNTKESLRRAFRSELYVVVAVMVALSPLWGCLLYAIGSAFIQIARGQ